MNDKEQKLSEKTERTDETQNTAPLKTLFEWESPGRPFRKRTKRFFVNSLLIVLLLEIIIFFFHEYLLMLVILTFLFVSYALNTIPPRNFRYKITTNGITIEDHFFLWQELYDFYFKKRFDTIEVLHIRTHALLPGEITMTIDEKDKNNIRSTLSKYIPYREIITPTFMDKSANWLTKNFPLEDDTPKKVATKVAS